jgi:hypothetical protein
VGFSPKLVRRVLWALFALTLPVPFYLGGFEIAPTVRLVFLSALTIGVVATEGAAGWLGSFSLLAAVQSLLWLFITWGIARLVGALISRARSGLRVALVASLVAALLGASMFDIYTTNLSSRSARSSLVGIFD